MRLDTLLSRPGLTVVYDGECPFCASYVRLVRLKDAAGPVALVDARMEPELVRDFKARGFNLNEGMAVVHGTSIYAGGDAIHFLSLLSSRSGLLNRGLARLFREQAVADRIYPYLRAVRNFVLRLLGRPAIGDA